VPALIAGNIVVVKPSPTTPLSTLKVAEVIKDLVPAGVINIVADNNELGSLLTAHPTVRNISFTGSTETGSRVMASPAKEIKRITLELGGNDAGIVLDDVDPKVVAPHLFNSAFGNSGQVCIALKRLYVNDNFYDEICDELAAIAKTKKKGNGMEEGIDLGPLKNKMQFEKVKLLIEEATE